MKITQNITCKFIALAAAAVLPALFFCSDLFRHPQNWGCYDWELFIFHTGCNYRSIVEFGEPPLWNPWYLGGFPMIGNPQVPSFNPWFLLDLLGGPVVAIKLKILGHYAIGLGGMYWCGRQFGLGRVASLYGAGTFMFSTWLALHIHSGHLWCLTAVYLPWVIGFLYRARRDWSQAVYGGMFLALMVLEGGGAHIVPLLGIVCVLLALGWAIQSRTVRPIGALLLTFGLGVGLSAVKSLPVLNLLGQFPRHTITGGATWVQYKNLIGISPPAQESNGRVQQPAARPLAADKIETPSTESSGPASRLKARPSRWDLPAFLTKVYLGRDQESDTLYFPIQGFGWQEYGTYLGPLAVVLLAISPWFLRTAWLWMAVAAFCFVTAIGNFAPLAPWTIMHRLPVLSNMRAPGRFLIPCAFAATMLASVVLDALLSRLDRQSQEGKRLLELHRRGWVHLLVISLVALALVDSFLVGRHSLHDSFPIEPPPLPPRLPSIVTVKNWKASGSPASAMLANLCSVVGDEVIPFPVRVTPREEPDYHGEYYFVDDASPEKVGGGQVELLSWSPNTVRVRVATNQPGSVVLNRNFAPGWVADAPYQVTPYRGLIATRLEPGTHEIRFAYRPAIVGMGLAVSLATGLGAVAFLVLSARPKRRALANGSGSHA